MQNTLPKPNKFPSVTHLLTLLFSFLPYASEKGGRDDRSSFVKVKKFASFFLTRLFCCLCNRLTAATARDRCTISLVHDGWHSAKLAIHATIRAVECHRTWPKTSKRAKGGFNENNKLLIQWIPLAVEHVLLKQPSVF